MGWTVFAKNKMLLAIKDDITRISLHTADPGENGDNEVEGNDYERASIDPSTELSEPSEGVFTLLVDKQFVGPPNGDATHLGVHNFDSSESLGYGILTGDILSFNSEGNAILKAGTSFDLNL